MVSGGLGGSVCSVVGWGVLSGCGWLNECWAEFALREVYEVCGVQGAGFTRWADFSQELVSQVSSNQIIVF